MYSSVHSHTDTQVEFKKCMIVQNVHIKIETFQQVQTAKCFLTTCTSAISISTHKSATLSTEEGEKYKEIIC